jgi:hypothetical protein
LRQEVALQDGISDATRTTVLKRLDVALEHWKSPRFAVFFFTVLVPGVVGLPAWVKQFTEFLDSLGIHLPTGAIASFASQHISQGGLLALGIVAFTYLLTVPCTAFMAKRGLFIGRDPTRIYFPGGQGGDVVYFKEREILAGVGVHASEARIDLWILGGLILLSFMDVWVYKPLVDIEGGFILSLLCPDCSPSTAHAMHEAMGKAARAINYVEIGFFIIALAIAAFRRRRTGRL